MWLRRPFAKRDRSAIDGSGGGIDDHQGYSLDEHEEVPPQSSHLFATLPTIGSKIQKSVEYLSYRVTIFLIRL